MAKSPTAVEIIRQSSAYLAGNYFSLFVVLFPAALLFFAVYVAQLMTAPTSDLGVSLHPLKFFVPVILLMIWAISSVCLTVAGAHAGGRPRLTVGRPDISLLGAVFVYTFVFLLAAVFTLLIGGVLALLLEWVGVQDYLVSNAPAWVLSRLGERPGAALFVVFLFLPLVPVMLWLMARLFLLNPHATLTGTFGFSAVMALTKGRFWTAFGAFIACYLAVIGLDFGMGRLMSAVSGDQFLAHWNTIAGWPVDTPLESDWLLAGLAAAGHGAIDVTAIIVVTVTSTVTYAAFTGILPNPNAEPAE